MMISPRSYLFSRSPSREKFEGRAKRPPRSAPVETDLPSPMSVTPAASTAPVVIPVRSNRDSFQTGAPHDSRRRHDRRARNVHSPDAIPPAVAALLAMTAIPPPKSNTPRRRSSQQTWMTVDDMFNQTMGESEKDLSMTLARSPLDVLLSSADEVDDLETLCSESGVESELTRCTISSESIPSLESGSFGASPSSGSLRTPSLRGRKSVPRRRLEAIADDLNGTAAHPLSAANADQAQKDPDAFQMPLRHDLQKSTTLPTTSSGFKSNLTASLRALKSAARSISSLKAPLMLPDDFLTRSIYAPNESLAPVPFSEDRMPPLLEDVPTPALRRYLNPITNAAVDAQVRGNATMERPIAASIQMQTYRVSRSGKANTAPVISRRTVVAAVEEVAEVATGPVARQRDVRENSDFIRIAVMEMAMRRSGKLDEKLPGRARWYLPPRKPATKPYEIAANGVPVRWVGISG